MADTLGGLIDKLFTIDAKLWNNQELLYEIRRMTFEQFRQKFMASDGGQQKLWKALQKCCDLNVQRNKLIDEIDEKVVEMVSAAKAGRALDAGAFIQRKHKTY